MMKRIVVVAIAICAPLAAQSRNSTAAGVPRTAEGKPDLTGVWQAASTRPGTWEEANSGFGVGGTGKDASAGAAPPASRTTATEPPPYQPWAAKKVLESFNNRGIDNPTAFCLPPGIPRSDTIALFPMQIVQTPQRVVMLYEYMSAFRVIPLNAKHPDDMEPSYMGDSVGRWEGDTLVVDVVSFNDKTWLGPTGSFHSEALHVTERFTRVGKDRINYDATVEDPNVFTKPWTIHSSMMLREDTRLREFVCAENNLDPGHFEKLLKDGVDFTRH